MVVDACTYALDSARLPAGEGCKCMADNDVKLEKKLPKDESIPPTISDASQLGRITMGMCMTE